MIKKISIFILSCFLFKSLYAENNMPSAITTPIPINQIKDYDNYSAPLKNLIHEAWLLSTQHLTYEFGSANPNNKGMDCSGTIYYLLNKLNVPHVPRDSKGLYEWVKNFGHFYPVKIQNFASPEFNALRPGDLLFWSGTYNNGNVQAISHVMLYLGKTLDGKPLMFGSSDGRSYCGKKMWGVSVFDFQLPHGNSNAKFLGYSCIPSLTCK